MVNAEHPAAALQNARTPRKPVLSSRHCPENMCARPARRRRPLPSRPRKLAAGRRSLAAAGPPQQTSAGVPPWPACPRCSTRSHGPAAAPGPAGHGIRKSTLSGCCHSPPRLSTSPRCMTGRASGTPAACRERQRRTTACGHSQTLSTGAVQVPVRCITHDRKPHGK